MQKAVRRCFAAALAAALLAIVVGSASANRLSFSNQQFRMVWTTFKLNAEFGVVATCALTLEGSFTARTIQKTLATIGSVTRAIIGHPCPGAVELWTFNGAESTLSMTLANSLPWSITYQSFEGTLPDITGVNVKLTGMRLQARDTVLGALATYGGPTETALINLRLSSGAITTAMFTAGTLRRSEGSFALPEIVAPAGTGNVTVLNSSSAVTVILF